MTKTELIAVRLTPAQRRKLELLATGERTSVSGVVVKLIDLAPAAPVRIVQKGLKLDAEQATKGFAHALAV